MCFLYLLHLNTSITVKEKSLDKQQVKHFWDLKSK